MTVLPNHDVAIGNIGLYAGSVKSDQPYKLWNYDKVDISMGMPRWYAVGITPRHITFTSTFNVKDRQAKQDELSKIQGIQRFTSIYIGSFSALVKVQFEWPDGFPNTLTANFDITEVES